MVDLDAHLINPPDVYDSADPACMCGHVLDEHDGVGECQVEGCPCFAYEEDEGS
jgi:hypothetical protein